MAYIDISITAPISAKPGEKVSLSVRLKNVSDSSHLFKATVNAVPDLSAHFLLGTIERNISSGSSVIAYFSFNMPGSKTTILVWAERWAVSSWSYVGSVSKVISVESIVPEYKGSISKKELEHNGSRASIPASNITLGKSGLIHIWGRNDTAIKQKLGISWIARNPSGLLVEDYKDWQFGSADPGATHEFIGGRFDINKEGSWTITAVLFMNPEAPVEVARYSGKLCSVIQELESAEFRSLTATYSRI